MDGPYFDALQDIITHGEKGESRVGPTLSRTGVQLRYDLRKEFPLPRHKRIGVRIVATELAWFLAGHSNVKWLQDRNVHIWDDDASKMRERGFDYPEGELGPIYGVQWRGKYPGGVDQIAELVKSIKTNPTSRRHIVTAWNPKDIPKMGLPPCHHTFQVRVVGDHMDLHLTMRSGDMGLGVPFNIVSYSILLMLLAKECDKIAREVVITVVDAHIYEDHLGPLLEIMDKTVRPDPEQKPIRLDLGDINSIDSFVDAHEKNCKFKLQVHDYPLPPKLTLPLHT